VFVVSAQLENPVGIGVPDTIPVVFQIPLDAIDGGVITAFVCPADGVRGND
jgi:hypothetical protein